MTFKQLSHKQIPMLAGPLAPDATEGLAALQERLTRAHYSRLRFYWTNRGVAPNQGATLDLELYGLGLLEASSPGHRTYRVTDLAVKLLAEFSAAEKVRRAPHHELASRVAQWQQSLGRMTWEGVEFIVREQDVSASAAAMSIALPVNEPGLTAATRPDVYSVVPTMEESRIEPQVFEVKVSRADYLADVAKPMKRLAYAQIADRVLYVVPAGLVSIAETPKLCGLVYEHAPGEFEIVQRAKRRRVTLQPRQFMNLVLKPGQAPIRSF